MANYVELSIDDLLRLITSTITQAQAQDQANGAAYSNGMVGQYVIVRCRDAGVHAGYLESYRGRECVLRRARRLWYWKPDKGSAFLSGVAVDGLSPDSKVGKPVERIHLTENCEIILCSDTAAASIQAKANHNE